MPTIPLLEHGVPQSPEEYLAALERCEGVPLAPADAPSPLAHTLQHLLSSHFEPQLTLLIGDAGSGKSTFVWRCAADAIHTFDALVAAHQQRLEEGTALGSSEEKEGEEAAPDEVFWLPVVLDLKRYAAWELAGLLPR